MIHGHVSIARIIIIAMATVFNLILITGILL